MNSPFTHKLLKYLANAVVIYLLFKYVPKTPMRDQDILVFTAIVIVAYAIFDNIGSLYYGSSSDMLTQGQCNSYCSIKNSHEGMESVAENTPSVASQTQSLLTLQPMNTNNGGSNMIPASVTPPVTSTVPSETPNNIVKVEQQVQSERLPFSELRSFPSQEFNEEQFNKPKYPQPGIKQISNDEFIFSPIKNPQIQSGAPRSEVGVMANEDIYVDLNNIPMVDLNSGSFESGYSYLPPSQWYPVPPHPPVCTVERKCPVCPINTTGLGTDLKEWNASRRVMPPDQINTAYVIDKLNAGR